MLELLKGKKALITGATGGIGKAICETFVKNGAELFITGSREEALKELADELKSQVEGAVVKFKAFSLGELKTAEELVKTANEELDGIDILVGNAGLNLDTLAIRMDNEKWQKVIDVNLSTNFVLSRECVKIMMKRRWGRIINMASIIGLIGNIGQANYSASKAGIIAMTKCIAQECASRGITANCIAPGFIDTPMTQKMPEEAKKMMISRIPLGRYGTPQDIANTALFLASDLSSYITGETISVNGGMLMN